VCCIYWVGEHKGNPDGALQCVSFVTYSVIYFYSVNILRNVKSLLPSGTLGRRVISFLYYVVSVEFVKKIPYLATYLGGKEDNNDKTVGEESK
jgi:multisubunit Na+/H+ antiporter MnhB subunit